jgi:hypothetical protein
MDTLSKCVIPGSNKIVITLDGSKHFRLITKPGRPTGRPSSRVPTRQNTVCENSERKVSLLCGGIIPMHRIKNAAHELPYLEHHYVADNQKRT